jgi:hypothetical protein
MDPVTALIVSTAADRLAGFVTDRLAQWVLGPGDKRVIERACRTAVRRAAEEARLNTDDTQRLVGLLDAVVKEIGAPGTPLVAFANRPSLDVMRVWEQAARVCGQDPATYPVEFGALVSRVMVLIPEEIAAAAGQPDSPIFERVMVTHIRQLTQDMERLRTAADDIRQARSVPLAGEVGQALEAAKAVGRAANRAFLTPDLVLALLQMPDRIAVECCDAARPGLGDQLRAQLLRYLENTQPGPFREFIWVERPDIRRAQQLAWVDGAAVVGSAYLLLGFLDSESRTRDQLATLLGDDFDRLREAALARRSTPSVPMTPGLVFFDDH